MNYCVRYRLSHLYVYTLLLLIGMLCIWHVTLHTILKSGYLYYATLTQHTIAKNIAASEIEQKHTNLQIAYNQLQQELIRTSNTHFSIEHHVKKLFELFKQKSIRLKSYTPGQCLQEEWYSKTLFSCSIETNFADLMELLHELITSSSPLLCKNIDIKSSNDATLLCILLFEYLTAEKI